MNTLRLHTDYANPATNISNIFIDQYMPLANGEFVKVYIYLLRCLSDQKLTLSIAALADFFNQTETDILRALKYWDKVGAIRIKLDETTNTVTDVTFCDLYLASSELSDIADEIDEPKINHSAEAYTPAMYSEDNTSTETALKAATDTRTAYTPAKILELKSHDDFKMLLYAIGTYLGGELSQPDSSTIAYIYDTLGFKSDLIEFLVEYCVTKGHRSMRYIEKTALAWAEQGLMTVAAAKAAATNHNETTYSVLGAFGITNRAAGKFEQDYITKWTDVYCFSNDIILEACNRTLKATHQPSFEYADSILKRWNDANVKDAVDIKKLDAAHDLKQKNTPRTAKTTSTGNRFNNFTQRNTDIDSLERTLISNH